MMTPQDREAIRALATFWRSQATEAQSEFPVDPCGLEQPAALRRCASDLDTLLSSLTAAAPAADGNEIAELIRINGKRLRDRVEAIRAESINPARPRGFDIGWQLGRLRDDVENVTIALMREARSQPSPTDGKAQEP
jgi:hypothetical protein